MEICTVFISKPKFEAGHPYVGFDNEQYKSFILQRLRSRFNDINFIEQETITEYSRDLMNKIREDMKGCDGLLIYTIGQYGNPGIVEAGVELVQMNLPTILANYPYGGDPIFLMIYDRVRGKGYKVLPISSPIFEDVERAINILRRLLRMKGKKILVYTLDQEVEFDSEGFMELLNPDLEKPVVKEVLNEMTREGNAWSFEKSYIDLIGTDQAHSWRRDEELYRKNLKDVFGVEILRRNPDDILEAYRSVDVDAVKKVIDEWKSGAKGIHSDTTERAIENAAKLYVVSRKLMERYGADAISFDCGTLFLRGKLPAFPCFAFSKLMDEGSTGICESDLDSGISALFVRYLLDQPSIITNHSLDTVHDRATYMHCWAPTRMYGKDKEPLSYEIDRHGESHGMGAVPFVEFPYGEKLTTIKISMLKKKIAIRSGKIIGTIRDEKACRVKVLVETNAKKILEKYDWDTFGLHRVSFLGDHRDIIRSAARLIGLEVYEEDS